MVAHGQRLLSLCSRNPQRRSEFRMRGEHPGAMERSSNFGRRSNAISFVFPYKFPVEFSERGEFTQQAIEFGGLSIHVVRGRISGVRMFLSQCHGGTHTKNATKE